jgi:hypothetical protein
MACAEEGPAKIAHLVVYLTHLFGRCCSSSNNSLTFSSRPLQPDRSLALTKRTRGVDQRS